MGFITGRKSNLDSTRVQITSSIRADVGVQVNSPDTNTSNIFIGPSGFTIDTTDVTDGFPLAPGDSILIPTRNPEDIWIATSGSGQKIFFLIQ